MREPITSNVRTKKRNFSSLRPANKSKWWSSFRSQASVKVAHLLATLANMPATTTTWAPWLLRAFQLRRSTSLTILNCILHTTISHFLQATPKSSPSSSFSTLLCQVLWSQPLLSSSMRMASLSAWKHPTHKFQKVRSSKEKPWMTPPLTKVSPPSLTKMGQQLSSDRHSNYSNLHFSRLVMWPIRQGGQQIKHKIYFGL